MQANRDILVLPGNTKGDDCITGDIHGNKNCLDLAFKQIANHDRLFIVGDLVDRGADSLNVVIFVMNNRNKIYTTRGNHEDSCLRTIEKLETLAALKLTNLMTALETITYTKKLPENLPYNEEVILDLTYIRGKVLHGRSWLVELFIVEYSSNRLNSNTSLFKQIKEYFNTLPYIICVQGKKPFKMVHADMPFEDDELTLRINSGIGLTISEKNYATWARQDEVALDDKNPIINPANRNRNAIITYVGHDVTYKADIPIVRLASNTVNLDAGSFFSNVSLLVNHTQGKLMVLSLNANIDKEFLSKTTTLKLHLMAQAKPESMAKNDTHLFFKNGQPINPPISTRQLGAPTGGK